jgi:hypothetical protein
LQDDDNLLGKRDLQLAADALGADLRDARPPGQRGGGGGRGAAGMPNPFTALFKELEVARMQSVDFTTFVTLEKRFPAICTAPNGIWATLQPYAAPAAALVRRLRLNGHLDFLAAPKHAKPLFVTASLSRLPSSASSRSSTGADSIGGGNSRNALRGSGGGGGAEQPGPRGRPKLPPLALSALRDEQQERDRRAGPPAGAAHGAAWPPRGGARGGGADDDDDLDGFAGWAASQRGQRATYAGADGTGRAAGAREGMPLRRAESMPREGSPVMRGRLPQQAQFGAATASGELLPTYSEFVQQRGGAYAGRAPSPTKQQLPPRADADADVGHLVAALAAPRARSPHKASARVTDDYYARMNEVAATRHLTRSSTLG